MVNSRQKGARGERQWAARCRDEGFDARRGQQYSGNPDAPDVVCHDIPWCHFEVKVVERLNLQAAMDKAKDDCGDKAPVVAHKRNRHEWLVTMRAEDWFKLVREYDE
jgi:Holliday junction resolvase